MGTGRIPLDYIRYNPIMMYAVVTYANMRGIRSVDRIVDLCERDLAFIWLTRGQNRNVMLFIIEKFIFFC